MADCPSPWIPAAERLPESLYSGTSDDVLVVLHFGFTADVVTTAAYDHKRKCWVDLYEHEPMGNPTHWMPFPAPPKA